ncbi:Uncharacterised protein [Weissella viridescens]|uniref:Uncharacterized protein n=1 Tax=Weissella viridescens TaxID=1629 RepID=A0A380P8S0_WEIVI|nr:Uncharacterised protein [Weissella viridescens]
MNKQAKAFFLIKGEQVLLDVLFLIPMCQVFIHALHRPDLAVPIWCIFVLYQVIAIGLTYQHTTYQIKHQVSAFVMAALNTGHLN